MRLLDVEDGSDFRAVRASRARLGVLLGLLFLAGPLSDLFDESLGVAHEAALLVGLAVFVALYVSLLPPAAWLSRLGNEANLVALGLLPVIAIVLLAAGAPTSFAALFVYFVAAAGMRLPPHAGVVVTLVTALGVGIAGWLHGDGGSAIAATVLTIVSIGILMTAFGRIARANRELRKSREELARLAVSEERLRIARDLHDLLGHSLSVIALKSELARKLVEPDPTRAAAELDDIQAVSRTALAEVREAVQGYRRLALAEAVESATSALAADQDWRLYRGTCRRSGGGYRCSAVARLEPLLAGRRALAPAALAPEARRKTRSDWAMHLRAAIRSSGRWLIAARA